MRYQGEDLIELIRVLFTAVEYLAKRSEYSRISEKSVCAVNIGLNLDFILTYRLVTFY